MQILKNVGAMATAGVMAATFGVGAFAPSAIAAPSSASGIHMQPHDGPEDNEDAQCAAYAQQHAKEPTWCSSQGWSPREKACAKAEWTGAAFALAAFYDGEFDLKDLLGISLTAGTNVAKCVRG